MRNGGRPRGDARLCPVTPPSGGGPIARAAASSLGADVRSRPLRPSEARRKNHDVRRQSGKRSMRSLAVPNAVFPVATPARTKARFNSWDDGAFGTTDPPLAKTVSGWVGLTLSRFFGVGPRNERRPHDHDRLLPDRALRFARGRDAVRAKRPRRQGERGRSEPARGRRRARRRDQTATVEESCGRRVRRSWAAAGRRSRASR